MTEPPLTYIEGQGGALLRLIRHFRYLARLASRSESQISTLLPSN
jgi:hypothetical protein